VHRCDVLAHYALGQSHQILYNSLT